MQAHILSVSPPGIRVVKQFNIL
uniref:Uncharacterized protein n=1 Tax=Anguilla anguilla TaxID=7936 RepID=A0A0E9S948_ANGAN